MPSPEELARGKIDPLLEQCGWVLQNRSTINLSAARGLAIREALLKDRDEVDYLLFVIGKAIGTVEAKPESYSLTGVEEQSGKYGKGLLDIYPKWREPLPFAYRLECAGYCGVLSNLESAVCRGLYWRGRTRKCVGACAD